MYNTTMKMPTYLLAFVVCDYHNLTDNLLGIKVRFSVIVRECVCLRVCQLVCLSVCRPAYLPVSICLCLSVCLSVCLPVCPPVCSSAYVSVCLHVCLPVCPSVYLSACLSHYLSVCLPVQSLSICLSVCLPVYLRKQSERKLVISVEEKKKGANVKLTHSKLRVNAFQIWAESHNKDTIREFSANMSLPEQRTNMCWRPFFSFFLFLLT